MADKRAFAKFDIGYLDNPKMSPVLDVSVSAVLMHAASILYCAQHLTNGLAVSRAMERKIGGTSADTRLLLDAGLWHVAGHDCIACPEVPEGKIYVHDFLEHNRSSEEAKRASEAGRAGALALHSKRQAKGNASAMQDASGSHADRTADRMPRERERKRDINTSSSPATPSMEFTEFWAAYPRKVGKQAAIKAYSKAMKLADPQKILEGIQKIDVTDSQYIPHPATWLNAGRWDDEVIKPKETYSPWDQIGGNS
ncbi:hypothetical protein HD598_002135 [Neomicrococcus aestuarii]|uniref:Uncharacterized protein n=1 Tax=Neomicrococcus aestuarii TaxID=556325 RepID=A0A7W8TWQ3_9MICC|nr:hypothetical protein [Neomicrococcus aestuarii]MBB5513448.1 hypothetical protein [Neomicrococcus aestuarii]